MKKILFVAIGTSLVSLVLGGAIIWGNDWYKLSERANFENVHSRQADIMRQW